MEMGAQFSARCCCQLFVFGAVCLCVCVEVGGGGGGGRLKRRARREIHTQAACRCRVGSRGFSQACDADMLAAID